MPEPKSDGENLNRKLVMSVGQFPEVAEFINGKLNVGDTIGIVSGVDPSGTNFLYEVGPKSREPGKTMDGVYYRFIYPVGGGEPKEVVVENGLIHVPQEVIDKVRNIIPFSSLL